MRVLDCFIFGTLNSYINIYLNMRVRVRATGTAASANAASARLVSRSMPTALCSRPGAIAPAAAVLLVAAGAEVAVAAAGVESRGEAQVVAGMTTQGRGRDGVGKRMAMASVVIVMVVVNLAHHHPVFSSNLISAPYRVPKKRMGK